MVSQPDYLYPTNPPHQFTKHPLEPILSWRRKPSHVLLLSVYPNPVMAGATVSIAGAEGKVNIYNTTGQLVKEVTVDASGALSTAGMQPGIYLLRLTSGATARLMVK